MEQKTLKEDYYIKVLLWVFIHFYQFVAHGKGKFHQEGT